MPLSVEAVAPKQALIGVGKVVSMAVRALEQVGAGFLFFSFQSWWIDLVISLAAPSKFSMVFRLVWAIIFDTLGSLSPAQKSSMALLPAVFALRYTRIHVGSSDCHDIIADIEAPID